MTNADRLVEIYILDAWRGDHPDHSNCPPLQAVNANASDSTFDMGVDRAWFSADVGCEHLEPAEYAFGEFGTVADLLEDVARDHQDELEGNTP